MELIETPQVDAAEPLKTPDAGQAGFSGKPSDFEKDMAKIRAEMGVPEASAQPDQPRAAEQPPVQVPEKFQTADGKLDAEKLQKSEVNIDEAIARYKSKEREFQQLQNKVNNHPYQPQQVAPQAVDPFVAQLNADLAANPQNPGLVLSKLFNAASQAGYERAKGEIDGIRQETVAEKQSRELEGLIKHDPWLASPEGLAHLSQLRTERNLPNFHSAYREYLADEAMKQRLGSQVQTPNPTAQAALAPATPVNAANRVPTTQPRNDKELNQMLNGMTAQQQKEFWQKAIPGMRRY